LEQQQAGHPQLGHDIATSVTIHKSQGDTFAEPFNGPEGPTAIPPRGVISLSNNIRSSDPHIGQLCSEETCSDLSSDNFSFGKFRHPVTVF
jgi:hypothetical protein